MFKLDPVVLGTFPNIRAVRKGEESPRSIHITKREYENIKRNEVLRRNYTKKNN